MTTTTPATPRELTDAEKARCYELAAFKGYGRMDVALDAMREGIGIGRAEAASPQAAPELPRGLLAYLRDEARRYRMVGDADPPTVGHAMRMQRWADELAALAASPPAQSDGRQIRMPGDWTDEEKAQTEAVAAWPDAYAAFKGAFDTPQMRVQMKDEYSKDARDRLRAFNELMLGVITPIEGTAARSGAEHDLDALRKLDDRPTTTGGRNG